MKRLFFMTFLALLPSCNGIFQGIYDSGEGDLVTEYGFLEYNPSEKTGTIYIDATDYTKWIYLDFIIQIIYLAILRSSDKHIAGIAISSMCRYR